MPTYGYQCTQCRHEFSVFQNMKDDPISTCPECQSPVKRLLYPVGIVFKGSGWYVNDSRKPDKSEASEAGDTKATDSSASETKAVESKTVVDSKVENKPTKETASTASASPKSSN